MNDKLIKLAISIGLGIGGIVGMNTALPVTSPKELIIFIIGFIMGIAGLILGFKNGKNFGPLINFLICAGMFLLCILISNYQGTVHGRQQASSFYEEMNNPTPVEEPIEYPVEEPIENNNEPYY